MLSTALEPFCLCMCKASCACPQFKLCYYGSNGHAALQMLYLHPGEAPVAVLSLVVMLMQ
jgi:hypothetical protein